MKKLLAISLALFSCLHGVKPRRTPQMETFYKGKNVLVTGGCGFIGSHLARELVNLGANVTILDDLSTGFTENIEPIADKITFIKGTVADMDTCLKATKDVTHIFHLAAFISVPLSVEHPAWCQASNVDGTFNMLEAARKNGAKRFVFSSSSAVYGAPKSTCDESTFCNPTSPYGVSKLIGEYLLQQYAYNYDLECVSMRYFNVYGQRQNPNAAYAAVVAKFRDLMSQDKPVTIFGDGTQTRDFIPVEQVVATNLMLGMLPASEINAQVYNVATGKSITVLDLFDELKQEFKGYAHKPMFDPPRPGDLKHSVADCRKLQQLCEKYCP